MDNGDKIRIHEDVASLKTDMNYVKNQVSNHIPSSIKEMSKANKTEHDTLKGLIGDVETSIHGIEKKIAYWAGGLAVIIILIQFIVR